MPEARLAILGGGPLEAETRALGSASSGSTAPSLLPGRTEIRDWLERADVFVHTSRWEGFGIVLLEAMLASLPVVATRVSAVPEVVVDGETGVLVEPGDVAGVAAALASLLADRSARGGSARPATNGRGASSPSPAWPTQHARRLPAWRPTRRRA